MKIAILTDTHWGCRGDLPAVLDKQEEFYKNCFFPELEKQGIKQILHLGDTFDRRKIVNFHTLKRTREMFFDIVVEKNYSFITIAGNHDVYYTNTNEINSLEMCLGNYAPNVEYIINEPRELKFGSLTILMCPWLTKDIYDNCMNIISKSKAKYLMGHFSIVGFEMDKGAICEHGLDKKVFSNFEQVFSGHFHQPSAASNIRYLGAPYEMTWADQGLERGFYVLDTETLVLERHLNPYLLHYKINYDDSNMTLADITNKDFSVYKNSYVKLFVKNRTSMELFDRYKKSLDDCGAISVSIQETNLLADSIDLTFDDQPKETIDIMKIYVDKIENIKTDKADQLKSFLSDLYLEASKQE